MDKKAFYNSEAWQRARQAALVGDNYLCVRCLARHRFVQATMVHHKEALLDSPEQALDLSNLESLCDDCHNRAHPEKGRRNLKPRPEAPAGVRIIKL